MKDAILVAVGTLSGYDDLRSAWDRIEHDNAIAVCFLLRMVAPAYQRRALLMYGPIMYGVMYGPTQRLGGSEKEVREPSRRFVL
ncbi:MAG TPA: hypothetical protein VF723_16885 [Pyrinomonadaceae bacterium]|jgi:hypothetical protein